MKFKWLIPVFYAVFIMFVSMVEAHEDVNWHHAKGPVKFYGNTTPEYPLTSRWVLNRERTVCIDVIFTHGLLHITDPFICEDGRVIYKEITEP